MNFWDIFRLPYNIARKTNSRTVGIVAQPFIKRGQQIKSHIYSAPRKIKFRFSEALKKIKSDEGIGK